MRWIIVILFIIAILFMISSEQNYEQIKSELQALKNEVDSMKSKIGGVSYPADYHTKESIRTVLGEQLDSFAFDKNWNNYFYYNTFFESLDGWGASGATATYQWTNLTTGAVSGDSASITKSPVYQDVLTYNRLARFRSQFHSEVTSEELFIGIGAGGKSATAKHYGFLLDGSTLKGVCANGTTQSEVTLLTGITDTIPYQIEARFVPGQKVVFYVKSATDSKLMEKGTLMSNLPSGAITDWISVELITRTTSSKQSNISFFEYIQERIES